jgi:hypothetical protein
MVLNALELHDSLGAWSGLGASVMALLRQARSPARISFSVFLVALLYVVVATLHISVPSVLSVGTVSTVGDLPSISAARMPGNVTTIGYDRTTETTSAELQDVITSIPYFWGQQNSTRFPPGWNGTWVIITHWRPSSSLIARHAARSSARWTNHCRVLSSSRILML